MKFFELLLGVLSSLLAAFLVSMWWHIRIYCAARGYCGTWRQCSLNGRRLGTMEGNPSITIRRSARLWGLWRPDSLVLEGEHDDGATQRRRKWKGEMAINPVACSLAVVTLRYVDDPAASEYAVQEYSLMDNGDIFVVPAATAIPPDYKRHVLQRDNASRAPGRTL